MLQNSIKNGQGRGYSLKPPVNPSLIVTSRNNIINKIK